MDFGLCEIPKAKARRHEGPAGRPAGQQRVSVPEGTRAKDFMLEGRLTLDSAFS
jgi:hypothetical protein